MNADGTGGWWGIDPAARDGRPTAWEDLLVLPQWV